LSTQKETIEFILEKLGEPKRFTVRAMFGEYALYASRKATASSGVPQDAVIVGLVCNDQLYVKILPESKELEDICEKDEAYPGSKKFYVVEEGELSKLRNLPDILLNIAKSLPAKPRPSGYGRGKKKVKK
jgi:DNA transformation protein and related proteins